MKKLVSKTAVCAGITAALSLVASQTALANSWSQPTQGGVASYNDGQDKLCASAWNSEGARWVRIVATPVNGVGPRVDFTDRNNFYGHPGATCNTSLVRAYEDTYYKAVIYAYWGESGTTETTVKYFYS